MRHPRVRSGLLAGVVIAATLLAFVPPAGARSCKVDDSGGAAFTTIQSAVADPSCTVIVVAPGQYTGPVNVPRSVTISGANAGVSPVTGHRRAESTLTSLTDGFVLNGSATNPVIAGMRIYASDAGIRATVLNSKPTIRRNVIVSSDDEGVFLDHPSSATIIDNDLSAGKDVVASYPSGQVKVARNKLFGTNDGVYTEWGTSASRVVVSNNVYTAGQGTFVRAFHHAGEFKVINNDVGNADYGVDHSFGGPATISGNRFSTLSSSGIFAFETTGALEVVGNTLDTVYDNNGIDIANQHGPLNVSRNTIRGSSHGGINLSYLDAPAVVDGNVVLGPASDYGIYLFQTKSATLSRNLVDGGGYAHLYADNVTGSLTLDRNTFVNNDADESVDIEHVTGDLLMTRNVIANNGYTDPSLFIDVVGGDATLSNNTFQNLACSAVRLNHVTGDARFTANAISNINQECSEGTTVFENIGGNLDVTRNVLRHTYYEGIVFMGVGGDVVVDRNSLSDSYYEGILLDGAVTGNVTITNNSIKNLYDDGIHIKDATADLTISGNTISVTPYSGIEFSGTYAHGAVTIERNVISNAARDESEISPTPTYGGIVIKTGAAYASLAINRNTIVDSVNGIVLDSALGLTPTVKFNRLSGNVNYGLIYRGSTPLDATNNWWGCNQGPAFPEKGCDRILNAGTGSVDFDPWLVQRRRR